MITDKWNAENYFRHIIDNKLDNIWTAWTNPSSVNGIRVIAYKPIYPSDGNVEYFDRKCARKGCNGTLIIPLDDRVRRIIDKRKCNGIVNGSACGAYQPVLYRWSSSDKRKVWFDKAETVRKYGKLGRAFYATNIIYDHKIVGANQKYIDEELIKACTLTIDIDIKNGTICESKNKEGLSTALDIIRDELSVFASDSYNVRTSGNGLYIELHHLLCDEGVFDTIGRYNAWILYMKEVIKEKGVRGIGVDAINMPSRVFKLIGSIHQKYDLVSIPLDWDCKFDGLDSEIFKLKNFGINRLIGEDGKLKWYHRYNKNDKSSLYKFLQEGTYIKKGHGDRALKFGYKHSVEIITGEKQIVEMKRGDTMISEADEGDEEERAKSFYEKYVGWKSIGGISGRGVYRRRFDGSLEIEFLGVNEEDGKKLVDKILKGEIKIE